jgi:CheY-like chemotaxis protein
MVEPRLERLLAFARRLQRASNFVELLDAALEEAREVVGYEHAWFLVADQENPDELRLIDVSGKKRDLAWEVVPVIKVKGDPFIEAIIASDAPVVIADARTDPRTNKQIVVNERYVATHPLGQTGALRAHHRHRHWYRHAQRRRRAHLRAFFHDQKSPGWHWTRLGRRVRHRSPAQRDAALLQRRKGRHFVQNLSPRLGADGHRRRHQASARGTVRHRACLARRGRPWVRAVATRILERGGYQVTAVEDGEAACRAAAGATFDLLVLDVVMPGMPCREVAQKVRALHPTGKILLSSGYTAGANVESLVDEHKLALLSKPYDPDQMLRVVRDVLDGTLGAAGVIGETP